MRRYLLADAAAVSVTEQRACARMMGEQYHGKLRLAREPRWWAHGRWQLSGGPWCHFGERAFKCQSDESRREPGSRPGFRVPVRRRLVLRPSRLPCSHLCDLRDCQGQAGRLSSTPGLAGSLPHRIDRRLPEHRPSLDEAQPSPAQQGSSRIAGLGVPPARSRASLPRRPDPGLGAPSRRRWIFVPDDDDRRMLRPPSRQGRPGTGLQRRKKKKKKLRPGEEREGRRQGNQDDGDKAGQPDRPNGRTAQPTAALCMGLALHPNMPSPRSRLADIAADDSRSPGFSGQGSASGDGGRASERSEGEMGRRGAAAGQSS